MAFENPSRHEGDHVFVGNVVISNLAAPNSQWGNSNIAPAAGVAASKLQQQPQRTVALTDHTVAGSVLRRVIYRQYGVSGTVLSFGVGATQAAGAASSITVDLKKNGVSILTATITLDNGTAAFAVKAGALSNASLAATDVLEAEITAVSGANLPKGVFVELDVRSDAD